LLDGAEVFFDPKKDIKDSKTQTVDTKKGSWADDGNLWAYTV
jgi:hypothetical protein